MLSIIASAPDRPGLVKAFGSVVRQCNGQVHVSRMVTLGNQFVIAALVDLASKTEEMETKLLANLQQAGFIATLQPTARPTDQTHRLPYRVHAVSLESPEVVDTVAQAIHDIGGNIAAAETDLTPAPWSGAPMFSFEAHVLVESGDAARRLRRKLEELSESEQIDIYCEPLRG